MDKKELLKELKKYSFSSEIIQAFEKVPRENFVPENVKKYAYENEPLPIGYGVTISQPYTIAFMLNLLELKNNLKILEIGSGSGYVLSLIDEISRNSEIYGIERIKELAESSKKILINNKNIEIFNRDGSIGLPDKAPFDRILVSAAADEIPKKIIGQLKENGILVCPVKNSILKIKKRKRRILKNEYKGFVFVPLIVNGQKH